MQHSSLFESIYGDITDGNFRVEPQRRGAKLAFAVTAQSTSTATEKTEPAQIRPFLELSPTIPKFSWANDIQDFGLKGVSDETMVAHANTIAVTDRGKGKARAVGLATSEQNIVNPSYTFNNANSQFPDLEEFSFHATSQAHKVDTRGEVCKMNLSQDQMDLVTAAIVVATDAIGNSRQTTKDHQIMTTLKRQRRI